MNAWTYLLLGIVFEVIGTTALKLSDGFSQPLASSVCVLAFITALFMLSQSVRSLDIGVVYAIWSGVGIALITLIGVWFFNELMTPAKIFFIALIAVGIAGLQIADGHSKKRTHAETTDQAAQN